MKDTGTHASDGIAVFSVVECKSYLDKAFKSIFFLKEKTRQYVYLLIRDLLWDIFLISILSK